jgi:hypothetical protein
VSELIKRIAFLTGTIEPRPFSVGHEKSDEELKPRNWPPRPPKKRSRPTAKVN